MVYAKQNIHNWWSQQIHNGVHTYMYINFSSVAYIVVTNHRQNTCLTVWTFNLQLIGYKWCLYVVQSACMEYTLVEVSPWLLSDFQQKFVHAKNDVCHS